MFREQTFKAREFGPGLVSISPQSRISIDRRVLLGQVRRERGGVKKNDRGMVFR